MLEALEEKGRLPRVRGVIAQLDMIYGADGRLGVERWFDWATRRGCGSPPPGDIRVCRIQGLRLPALSRYLHHRGIKVRIPRRGIESSNHLKRLSGSGQLAYFHFDITHP